MTITSCAPILTDVHLGDSISVNGTCLTVTSFFSSNSPSTTLNVSPTSHPHHVAPYSNPDESQPQTNDSNARPDSFTVGCAPETLRRTNLGSLKQGGKVNLERAVSADTRMGGHFVQGHVDTVCTILSITPDGNALTFRLQPRDRAVLRYVVEKGYVTLDGASLTVVSVDETKQGGWFEVMLISYTQEKIVTASKKVGDDVNFEADQVGKYVEKSVEGYFQREAGDADIPILRKMVDRLVEEKLKALGH